MQTEAWKEYKGESSQIIISVKMRIFPLIYMEISKFNEWLSNNRQKETAPDKQQPTMKPGAIHVEVMFRTYIYDGQYTNLLSLCPCSASHNFIYWFNRNMKTL